MVCLRFKFVKNLRCGDGRVAMGGGFLCQDGIEFVPKPLPPGRFQRISSCEHYRVGGDVGAYLETMESVILFQFPFREAERGHE